MRGSMHLRRIDPDRNMARSSTMSIEPTLFGEWALLREWGRIGAAAALTAQLKAKLRHGYLQLGAPHDQR